MTKTKIRLLALIVLFLTTTVILATVFYVKKNSTEKGKQTDATQQITQSSSGGTNSTATTPSKTPASTPQPAQTPAKSPAPTKNTPTTTSPNPQKSTTSSGAVLSKVCGTAGYNGSTAGLPLFESKYPSFWRTDYSFADLYGATGQIFENFKLPTEMYIKSNSVTIRNFYLSPGDGYYPMRTDNREAGAGSVITNGTIAVTGATDDKLYKGIVADTTNMTISDMDISGTHDGISVGSGSVSISNVCIHDLASTPTAHNDGIEIYGADSVTIRNSEINNKNDQTSAINITNDYGSINNVLIENVTLSGGGYTIYVRGDGASSGAITNIRFRNVTIAKAGFYGVISYQDAPGAIVEWDVKDANGNPIPHP